MTAAAVLGAALLALHHHARAGVTADAAGVLAALVLAALLMASTALLPPLVLVGYVLFYLGIRSDGTNSSATLSGLLALGGLLLAAFAALA